MTIKEVSEKYSISQDTLRYYEKVGLIRPVTRKNGIRQYGEMERKNIEFVLCMRGAGLPIENLVEYMRLCEQGDETVERRRQILVKQREVLKQKIAEMNAALEKPDYKIDVYYDEILKREKSMLNRGE
jgi:DNA-binding transcriptional MerR regulator